MKDLSRYLDKFRGDSVRLDRPSLDDDIRTIVFNYEPFVLDWKNFRKLERDTEREAEEVYKQRALNGDTYTDIEKQFKDDPKGRYDATKDRDWVEGKVKAFRPEIKRALESKSIIGIRPDQEDLESICMDRNITLVGKEVVGINSEFMVGNDIILLETEVYEKVCERLKESDDKSKENAVATIKEVIEEELTKEKPKLLIVDNEMGERLRMTEIALKCGFSTRIAENPEQAFQMLEKEKDIGTIITGDIFPGTNGLDFIMELRKRGGEQHAILVSDEQFIEKEYEGKNHKELLQANVRVIEKGGNTDPEIRSEFLNAKGKMDLMAEKTDVRIEEKDSKIPTFADFENKIRDYNSNSGKLIMLDSNDINEVITSFKSKFKTPEDYITLSTLNNEDMKYILTVPRILKIEENGVEDKAIDHMMDVLDPEERNLGNVLGKFYEKIKEGWTGEDVQELLRSILRKEDVGESIKSIYRNRKGMDDEVVIERNMREGSDFRTSIFFSYKNAGRVAERYNHYSEDKRIKYNLGITTERVSWVAKNNALLARYLEMFGAAKGKVEHDSLVNIINQDRKDDVVSIKESKITVDSKYHVYEVTSTYGENEKRHSIVKFITNPDSFEREVYNYNYFKRFDGINDANSLVTTTVEDEEGNKNYVVVLNFKEGVEPRQNLMTTFENIRESIKTGGDDVKKELNDKANKVGIQAMSDVGRVHGVAPELKGDTYTSFYGDFKKYLHFRIGEFQDNLTDLVKQLATEFKDHIQKNSSRVKSNSYSLVEYLASMDTTFYKDTVTKNMTPMGEEGGKNSGRFASVDYGEVRKLPLTFDVANAVHTMYIPDIRVAEEDGTIDQMLISYLSGYCEGRTSYNNEVMKKKNVKKYLVDNLERMRKGTGNESVRENLSDLLKIIKKEEPKHKSRKKKMAFYKDIMSGFAESSGSDELKRVVANEIKYFDEIEDKPDPYFGKLKIRTSTAKGRRNKRYEIISDKLKGPRDRWSTKLNDAFERFKADFYVSMAYRGQVIANTVPVYILSDHNINKQRRDYFSSVMGNTTQALEILSEKYIGKEKGMYLRRELDGDKLNEVKNALSDIRNIFEKIDPGAVKNAEYKA